MTIRISPQAVCRALLVAWLAFAGSLGLAQSSAPASAREQMVVAANPHATAAGLTILRAGGSAVDAAVAVQLVLSLVEPQSSGIGGGAFMLHWSAGSTGGAGQLIAYSGRETAPKAATADMFLDANGRVRPYPEIAWGGLSVGVPGVMRMLELAHTEHGQLPWEALFAPAIELAENGFEISPRLYFLLDRFKGAARAETFRAHYFDAAGEAYRTGHLLVNEAYAETLRALAADGADAMYGGPLAEAIVAAVGQDPSSPGRMTVEDLAGYRAEKSPPLCTPYREWTVCGPRLPSSGGITVQQILGIAQHFALAVNEPVQAIHILAEASRLAFADRNVYLADPEFVPAPVEGLLSPAYLRDRASLIRPAESMRSVAPGTPENLAAWNYASSEPNDIPSTSHFSIVDRLGNAVSMTTSVQSAFGSQLMVGGFLLNNQLTDFSYEPEQNGRPIANRAAPGKRPLSSMAPTVVLDAQDRLHMLIGSPGGTRIIGFVAQALVGVLDFGFDIQRAVAAPHFIAQSDALELEERTALLEHVAAFEAMGHRVEPRNLNSGLHGIVIEHAPDGRILYGGVDPRREGLALGD